jgi:DUF1365 family protein
MHSCIFSGQVKHSRAVPVGHAFQYRVFMMYLDLEELPQVFRGRWFWSATRPALARFRRENYFGDADEPLEKSVRDLVMQRTGRRPTGPIRLLTNLSYFGYCFNPISIYYCFDARDTRVETIVAEVSNTPWGERHCYLLADSANLGDEHSPIRVLERAARIAFHGHGHGIQLVTDFAVGQPRGPDRQLRRA